MWDRSRQRLSNLSNQSEIKLSIDYNEIKWVPTSKRLGIIIDENLQRNVQVNCTSKKVPKGIIVILRRATPFVFEGTTTKIVYKSFVLPHLDLELNLWVHFTKYHENRI